ncbi:MAG: transglycosylase domain-containing protein [Bacteroidia bacterium]|nr:transglycosylase domain-containing protein [Bacteroidia bacterium]MDW8016102.1 transglycosylase domain-containing protein [Bacteroidia bacterium]
MLLWPLRWLLRQLLGIVLTLAVSGIGLLWILRWIPCPPLRVMKGFFSGKAPQWGWIGEGPEMQKLQTVLKRLEEQPSLRRRAPLPSRVAALLFFEKQPPEGVSALIGSLIAFLWGEERLWAFYLNSIPYDSEVYGVKAAARRYFQKELSELSPAELAELILRREGPPFPLPLPLPLQREKQRLAKELISLSHS